MKIDVGAIQQGVSTPVSPSYQDLLKDDSRTPEACYTARGTDFVNPDTTQVSIGTIVTLRETTDGRLDVYTILGAWDGDPDKGIVSYQSALAQALLAHKVGEIVDVPTEHGDRRAEIMKIEAYRK